MWVRRAAAAAAVTAAATLTTALPAQAADSQGLARFANAGVRVHDLSVLDAGCLGFGICGQVTPAGIANIPTIHRADRKGEVLGVLCRVSHTRADDDVLKVRLFGGPPTLRQRLFATEESPVQDGLVAARQIDDAPPVGECGLLD